MTLNVAARRVAILGAVTSCFALSAGAASAATNPFGCRASLARVTLGKLPIEPTVANRPTTPCDTQSGGVNSLSIPTGSNPFLVVGPAGVFTFSSSSQPTTTGPVLPGAAAVTDVDGATIPTGNGGKIVIVGPVQNQVGYACTPSGTVTETSSSTLDVIYVNGRAIALPGPGQPLTIPLGGSSFIKVNEKVEDATSLTERILHVHLEGLADIVVGEAKVTRPANPCPTGTTGGGGGTGTSPTPPTLNPCPAGSTLDVVKQQCVIVLPNGTVIVISKPFGGPTGGTVVSLGAARKKYHSKCLFGAGPQYVIVGTNGPDRINGTHRPERILGLGGNDRLAGQGGNDCIDGGAGNDKIYGGNGNERIYGGTGNDRISVQNGSSFVDGGLGTDLIFMGNGNNTVYGGTGNDRISVGRGNNHVYGGPGNDTLSAGDGNNYMYGGPGNDRIYVGNGYDRVFGGPGNDRIYGPGLKIKVDCGTGHNTAYLVSVDQPYARAHGCQNVLPLPIKRPF